jgi:hypothetical protein
VGAHLSRHAPNTHRFDFAVTLMLIVILATLLLGYINKVQHDIEKLVVETELNSLRLSLAEAWVHNNVNNQTINSATAQNSNPMLLVAEKPKNYQGELAETPSNNKAIWYFDTTKKQLIYVFNDGSQARYTLSKTTEKARAALLAVGGLDLVQDVAKDN